MASEVNVLLDELEMRIDKLKILYEQYFMGLEKLEPVRERQGVARIVRRIQTAQTTNTALRFRLNSLNQRFMSYQNYWNRIQRQIENGTYHRDLARVERDMKRKGIDVSGLSKLRNKGELEAALMQSLAAEGEPKAEPEPASGEAPAAAASTAKPPPVPPDGLVFGPPSAEHPEVRAYTLQDVPGMAKRGSPAQPPPPPPTTAGRAKPPPPPPPTTGTAPRADERMQRLYKAYVTAKKRTGETTDGLTYDRLVRTLKKQVPAIQKKTGCRRVDFKIEIREGKAVLKAVPKK